MVLDRVSPQQVPYVLVRDQACVHPVPAPQKPDSPSLHLHLQCSWPQKAVLPALYLGMIP